MDAAPDPAEEHERNGVMRDVVEGSLSEPLLRADLVGPGLRRDVRFGVCRAPFRQSPPERRRCKFRCGWPPAALR